MSSIRPRSGRPWLLGTALLLLPLLADAQTPLHDAARRGDLDALRAEAATRPRVDLADVYQVTPLLVAAGAGKTEAVALLLQLGADPGWVDAMGWTALHHGARRGRVRIVRELTSREVDLERRDRAQRSPLQLAARYGHHRVVGALLGAGAKVNARRRASMTALHLGVMGRHPRVVKLLLRNGASVKATAGRGVTPLHLAALNGDESICRALLGAGADPGTKNMVGRTPMQVAARSGHPDALLPSVAGAPPAVR